MSKIPALTKSWILQDFRANRHRPRAQALLAMFRVCQATRWPFTSPPTLRAKIATAVYLLFSEWILGMEIPVKTTVGPRLRVVHGYGLVVNVDSRIGSDVTVRHGVTIGNNGEGGPSPTIGDGADIGAAAIVIGGIVVGAGARVGAGAVVVHDVPPGATAVGNPARILAPSPGHAPLGKSTR